MSSVQQSTLNAEAPLAACIAGFFPDFSYTNASEFRKRVWREAYDHSIILISSSRLQPDAVRAWVAPVVSACRDFEFAVSIDDPPLKPWTNKTRLLKLADYPRPYVDKDSLEWAVGQYLGGPLRSRTLDRALVDAIIYVSIRKYLDGKAGLSVLNNRLFFVSIMFGSLFWIAFFNDNFDFSILSLSLTPAAIVLMLWAFPHYGHYSRYKQAKHAYGRLAAEATSPSELNRQLQKIEGWIPLPPELFALLDDVTARGSTL